MTPSPIDTATFTELQDTAGADFVVELVDTFLEEAPLLLDELEAARAGGDAVAFQRAAHSLKSNANTFGAFAFGSMARDFELGGLTKAPDAAALQGLRDAYAQVAAALKGLQHG
jgi:HPt (histidine-containing phosphotransfer) domain-containing protein